jgi:hypothetical protein
MASRPATAQLMKNQYMPGRQRALRPHQVKVAAGSDAVPGDLFPSQTDRVQAILAGLKKG